MLPKTPTKERKLNTIYKAFGGIRAYVATRLHEGATVEELALQFSTQDKVSISRFTLYNYIKRWEQEAASEPESAAA